MAKVAGKRFEILENGKRRSVTILEAIVLSHAKDALNGNTKAAIAFLDRCETHLPDEPDPVGNLPEEDEAAIRRFLAREGGGDHQGDDDED